MKKNNILIAEFMGFDTSRIVEELPVDSSGNYTTENNKWVYAPSLQYDTSWDFLMPVVEKIESLYASGNITQFTVHIIGKSCSILKTGAAPVNNDLVHSFIKDYIRVYGETPIDGVYTAVIEFIKRYNKFIKQ